MKFLWQKTMANVDLIQNIPLPDNWEPMGEDENFKEVKLDPTHEDYVKISQLFINGANQAHPNS